MSRSRRTIPRVRAEGLARPGPVEQRGNAIDVLDGVDGIGFTHFTRRDVVRHPLVAKIIHAYEADAENG